MTDDTAPQIQLDALRRAGERATEFSMPGEDQAPRRMLITLEGVGIWVRVAFLLGSRMHTTEFVVTWADLASVHPDVSAPIDHAINSCIDEMDAALAKITADAAEQEAELAAEEARLAAEPDPDNAGA